MSESYNRFKRYIPGMIIMLLGLGAFAWSALGVDSDGQLYVSIAGDHTGTKTAIKSDASGYLDVNCQTGCGGGGGGGGDPTSTSATGAAVPANASYIAGINGTGSLTGLLTDAGGILSTNIGKINGVTPLMGTGAMGTGSPRVTIANNNDPLAVTQSGTWTVQPGNTANTTAWKVDGSAVTQPVSGTVTVNALPAGTNRIGAVYMTVGTVYDEAGNAITLKRAFGSVAASQTDSAIITAVTSRKLRIFSAYMQCGSTATNITFNTKPAGASSVISPTFQNAANGGEVLPEQKFGWFESASGDGITATTGAGATTYYILIYGEIP